jgi:hypothetical protein
MTRLPALRRVVLLCVPCALWATAALGAKAAFFVPRAELRAAVKTVGVMPVTVDDAVGDADEVAALLEAEIAARLKQGGFVVVPASAMRAVRERAQAALGGLYDPLTGVGNPERIDAFREFSEHEYQALHPVDALVRAEVVRRQATLRLGEAEWDGVQQRLASKASSLFGAMTSGGPAADTIPALSVAVRLTDAGGKTLYAGAGGLLALSPQAQGATVPRYVLVPSGPHGEPGEASLIERALTVALDPLTTGALLTSSLSFSLQQLPAQTTASANQTLKDLLRDHRRLGVAALELPAEDPAPRERMCAHYQALLLKQLGALGFKVESDPDSVALWAAERTAAGGFYDPLTGRLDMKKVNAARVRLLARMRERHNVSTLVVPTIVPRSAPSFQGYARWDGAALPVTGGGSFFYNSSIFNSNIGYSGTLEAYSLRLQVSDEAGTVLFEGFGGLELRAHLEEGEAVAVPATALFTQPAAEGASVGFALESLTKQQARDRACTSGC